MHNFVKVVFLGALLAGFLTSCATLPPPAPVENPAPVTPSAAAVPAAPAPVAEMTPAPVASVATPVATPMVAPAAAPPAVPAENKNGLAFGGQVFLSLQNWSKVKLAPDSRLGVGLGGSLGIGFRLDDMKVTIGPSLWKNTWSASATQENTGAKGSVYLTMNDAGLSLMSYFGDMFLEMGMGQSTISSGVTVNGRETSYSYAETSFSYKAFGIGFKSESILFGLGIKNYDGLANSADHVNFMIGLGF